MKLTKNFSLSEFECKDGSITPMHVLENLEELAENLQVLRDYIDKPIHINSGYRSVEYNLSIGGVSRSMHILGKASDIRVKGMTSEEVHRTIEHLIREGKMKQGGLGLYTSANFVHYDIRGTKARWKK